MKVSVLEIAEILKTPTKTQKFAKKYLPKIREKNNKKFGHMGPGKFYGETYDHFRVGH